MPYPNAPLALVVCEVRFPEQLDGISPKIRPLVRDAVRHHLPLVEEMREDTVQFGPAGPPTTMRQTFPRFVSRDRTSALALNATSLVVETTAYERYRDFRSLVEASAGAVADYMRPDGILRVGLRYIDEIRVPGVDRLPGDWRGYVDNHLLATVDPDFLTETKLEPQTWQGFVRYGTGPGSSLTVRYGPQMGYAVNPNGPTRRRRPPAAGAFFLLDSDSYWEPDDVVPEFRTSTVVELCDQLHPPTRAIFEAVSTGKLRDEVYNQGGRGVS